MNNTLLMHVLPVTSNGVWQRNVEQVAARRHLFNRVYLAIAHQRRAFTFCGQRFTLDKPQMVLDLFKTSGIQVEGHQIFPNDTRVRDTRSFRFLLECARTTSCGNLFYCHSKGVTSARRHGRAPILWMEAMYRSCLDRIDTVEAALSASAIAGAFRVKQEQRWGRLRSPWHYSGTFFWLRPDELYRRDWRDIPDNPYGVEAWPGLHYHLSESACLFCDDLPPNGPLYREKTWERILHCC